MERMSLCDRCLDKWSGRLLGRSSPPANNDQLHQIIVSNDCRASGLTKEDGDMTLSVEAKICLVIRRCLDKMHLKGRVRKQKKKTVKSLPFKIPKFNLYFMGLPYHDDDIRKTAMFAPRRDRRDKMPLSLLFTLFIFLFFNYKQT